MHNLSTIHWIADVNIFDDESVDDVLAWFFCFAFALAPVEQINIGVHKFKNTAKCMKQATLKVICSVGLDSYQVVPVSKTA